MFCDELQCRKLAAVFGG